jgi:phosphoglucomutase/phosphomannomutase
MARREAVVQHQTQPAEVTARDRILQPGGSFSLGGRSGFASLLPAFPSVRFFKGRKPRRAGFSVTKVLENAAGCLNSGRPGEPVVGAWQRSGAGTSCLRATQDADGWSADDAMPAAPGTASARLLVTIAETEALKGICALLADRYLEQGQGAASRLQQWLAGAIPYAYPEILAQHLAERHLDLLFDAFWQVLPFGTGGRRGKVGYGANRLNPTTVAMTVQGHCHYLRAAFPASPKLAVVVANDVRVFRDIAGVYGFLGGEHPLLGVSSRSLAKLACAIYAGNGILAYLAEPDSDAAVLATPALSFLINRLGAVGGINLSASHNPPDDNGVKVYDEHGSQPVAPDDQHLVEAMNKATQISSVPFNEALAEGLIRAVPPELHEEYVQTYVRLYGGVYTPRAEAPIVYTPLCGCGLSTVGAVLKRLGFPFVVPPRQEADGAFEVIPFKAPNPEVAEATEPAKAFADEQGLSLVLASDPDADRVGLEAKLADGSWYHFDGNQIAAILCYFLMLDPQGPRRKGLVIETLVTTKLLGKIVEQSPGSLLIDDLLVGFKYVADVLKSLEQTGRYGHVACSPEQLVLAAEESHGVMLVPSIRDKDATPACMYLAALYQRLRQEGRTLLDYYVQILEECGAYETVNRSITMSGAEGMLRKDRILASLRQAPPETLAGQKVQRVVDHWDQEAFGPFVSETDQLPRNVVQYFAGDFIITVRPSGTEPKLKFYCQLLPSGEPPRAHGLACLQEARQRAEAIARSIYNELLSRVGLSLGEAALWLPDLVDLDRKRDFEQKTARELRDALAGGRFDRLEDLLGWLRGEVASMTPGADPLPALKAPLACLCERWRQELPSAPLLAELANWASQ